MGLSELEPPDARLAWALQVPAEAQRHSGCMHEGPFEVLPVGGVALLGTVGSHISREPGAIHATLHLTNGHGFQDRESRRQQEWYKHRNSQHVSLLEGSSVASLGGTSLFDWVGDLLPLKQAIVHEAGPATTCCMSLCYEPCCRGTQDEPWNSLTNPGSTQCPTRDMLQPGQSFVVEIGQVVTVWFYATHDPGRVCLE